MKLVSPTEVMQDLGEKQDLSQAGLPTNEALT